MLQGVGSARAASHQLHDLNIRGRFPVGFGTPVFHEQEDGFLKALETFLPGPALAVGLGHFLAKADEPAGILMNLGG